MLLERKYREVHTKTNSLDFFTISLYGKVVENEELSPDFERVPEAVSVGRRRQMRLIIIMLPYSNA